MKCFREGRECQKKKGVHEDVDEYDSADDLELTGPTFLDDLEPYTTEEAEQDVRFANQTVASEIKFSSNSFSKIMNFPTMFESFERMLYVKCSRKIIAESRSRR